MTSESQMYIKFDTTKTHLSSLAIDTQETTQLQRMTFIFHKVSFLETKTAKTLNTQLSHTKRI